MDPFTERILERARERQKKLLQSKDIGSVSPLGESNTLSTSSLEDFKSVNMTPTVSDSMLCTKTQVDSNLFTETQSEENVRVEVEFHEENDEGKENIKHDSVGLRDDAKMRLERLGRLYAGGEDANISSPIHQTEAKFVVEETPSKKVERKGPGRLGKGLGALNTLAQDINEWEDDLSTSKIGGDKPSVKKKSWKPPAPRPPISSTGRTVKEDCVNDGNSHTEEEKPRQINLDPTLVETLLLENQMRSNNVVYTKFQYDQRLLKKVTVNADEQTTTL